MGDNPLQLETEQVSVCRCGRVYTHCRRCGKRNPYVKRIRSMDLSLQLGFPITAYSCQRCAAETHTGMDCQAPVLDTPDGSDYVPYTKPPLPTQPMPWGHAVAGSEEHGQMLADWVIEQQKKHAWDSVRVYVEAQKAGWHLEAFGDKLDADIKQTLVDRGLLLDSDKDTKTNQPSVEEQSQVNQVSLDDIIKNMQENAK